MDQIELRSGKALVKGDKKGDSNDDPDEDVGSLMEAGYAMGGDIREELIPPRKIVHVDNLHPPPSLSAMDISSVRVPPTLAMTSLELTSDILYSTIKFVKKLNKTYPKTVMMMQLLT